MQLETLLKKLRELKIHLSLSEDQLVCRAPKGVMTKELSSEISAHKAEILKFLKAAAQSAPSTLQINKADEQSPPLVSFGQNRLWFLYELEGPSSTYNMPLCLRIKGNFEVPVFEQALNIIISRHQSLRYNFVKSADGPAVIVSKEKVCHVSWIDLSQSHTKDFDQIIASINQSTFDLSKDLLLRASVIRTEPNTHYVVILMHHIIADGWSIDVLFNELKTLYFSLLHHQPISLPALEIQYSDYAKWQHDELQGKRLQELADYWKNHLAGAPDFITLKTDFPRPNYPSYVGGNLHQSLGSSLSKAIKQLAQQSNCTLFMTLLTGFSILLSSHANQKDIVVGSPVANRNHADLEKLIGLFINTLPLRIDLTGNPTVFELLERIKKVCIHGFSHQEIPFEKIVEEINPTRSLNYSPLYQVAFDVQNLNKSNDSIGDLEIETLNPDNPSAKFDLSLTIQDEGDDLVCLGITALTYFKRIRYFSFQIASHPYLVRWWQILIFLLKRLAYSTAQRRLIFLIKKNRLILICQKTLMLSI